MEVPDPADTVVEALIDEIRHWVGALGAMSQHAVAVSLFAVSAPWRLGQPLPNRIDRMAVYDFTEEHGTSPCRTEERFLRALSASR